MKSLSAPLRKKDYEQESFDLSQKIFTAPLELDPKQQQLSASFETKHIVPSSRQALQEETATYEPSFLEKEHLDQAQKMPVHEVAEPQPQAEENQAESHEATSEGKGADSWHLSSRRGR